MAKGESLKTAAAEALKTLTDASSLALKTIADAAQNASRVISANASTTASALNVSSSGDHDLLVELKTTMAGVKADIKDLADGTTKTIADHEQRIRNIEKQSDDFGNIKKVVYGAIGFILISVLGALVFLVVKK